MTFPVRKAVPHNRPLTKHEERHRAAYPETDTFHWHNENPRGRLVDDCVVRAIARATGSSWDDTFEALVSLSRVMRVMPNERTLFARLLDSMGWEKHPRPLKPDRRRYTGAEFCRLLSKQHPKGDTGPIVAHIGIHHLVCIVPMEAEGRTGCQYKVLDTWDSTNGRVGNYWTKGAGA